jgi:hypothetical protein
MSNNWFHEKDPKNADRTFILDGETGKIIGNVIRLPDGRHKASPNGKKVSDFNFASAARAYVAASYYGSFQPEVTKDSKQSQFKD